MGDSKATILAFIFRMPEATFTKAQVCLTRATNIFSTKVRFLRTFGTAPSQRLFERASLGTFPLLMSPRHPLQILLQPWSRTGPLYSLMGLVSNFLSIRVTPGSSRMFNKFFTLLRRLVFFLSSSSPHTAHPTSSKFSGFIRVHASLMIACSRCLLAGSGRKEILISGVWFLSEA